MILILIFLFVAIPVLELYLLIQATAEWGLLSTLAIVIFTGVVGAFLARVQGFSLMMQLQGELSKGKMPADAIINGLLVLVGGLLLLTPGFFTDFLGFSFVLPITRIPVAKILKIVFARKIAMSASSGFSNGNGFSGGFSSSKFGGNFQGGFASTSERDVTNSVRSLDNENVIDISAHKKTEN